MQNTLDSLPIGIMNNEYEYLLRGEGQAMTVFSNTAGLSYFFDRKNGVEGHRDENHKWHGVILFYDPNNKMELYKAAEFRHGVLHGDTKHFCNVFTDTGYPNGVFRPTAQLESVFQYNDGTLVYTELYEAGILRELAHENGVNGGLYRKFHSSGKILEEGYSIGGLQQGTYTTFDENGKVASKAEFKNGKKDGSEELYQNGELKFEIAWRGGMKHGKEVEYGRNKFSCVIRDSLPDDLRHGNVRTERTFRHGVLSGPYLEIVDGFALVKGHYLNDLRNGIWEYYDESHKLLRKETFNENILHGPIMLAVSSKEIIVGVMVKGKKEGQFDHINPNTLKPISSDVYQNGVVKFFILYNKAGLPKEIGQVRNSQKWGFAMRIAEDGSRSQVFYRADLEVGMCHGQERSTGILIDIEDVYMKSIIK